jgi:hypothetical protein
MWRDTPPGPADPYGGESFLEKRRREREEAGLDVVKEKAKWKTEAKMGKDGYKPATTWDGMEHVGYTGLWWEKPEVEGEQFLP